MARVTQSAMTLTWMTCCRLEFSHTEESTCHLFIQLVNCGSFLFNHSIPKRKTHTRIWLISCINIYPKYIFHPLPYYMVDSYLLLITFGLCITPHDPKLHPHLSLCFYDLTNLAQFAASVLLHPYSISPQQCHPNTAIILESLNSE